MVKVTLVMVKRCC